MVRSRRPSAQMLALLASLFEQAPRWIHGYDLMRATGLKSGTLYPLLMRMTDQELVEAEWHPPTVPGRPPRHAYRLTAQGLALARDAAVPAAAGMIGAPA
jgi:PadR family transcriptional regulator PadR